MIKINGTKIDIKHFPDGTQCITDFNENIFCTNPENTTPYYEIVWLYENDEEMFTLLCLVSHLRDNHIYSNNIVINLVLPYLPNARMDKTLSKREVFTLKYFANFINSFNFNKVGIFDSHSNVSLALLNRLNTMDNILYRCITDCFLEIDNDYIDDKFSQVAIYFPDEGSYERYKKYFRSGVKRYCVYGRKNRDSNTGKIIGLEIYNEQGEKVSESDIKNKVFLMIDDIISYGNTIALGADRLKELGAKAIYVYASHTEDNILDKENGVLIKRLENGTINKLFTTNSLFKQEHEKIKLIYNF